MSFMPRPCSHCQSARFHVVPGVQLEIWQTSSVLGLAASKKVSGGRGGRAPS
jgi:hypothetical protein